MTTSLITGSHRSHRYETPRVPYAEEMLHVARYSNSFQTLEVLQRIVLAEQQRIREEQMLWRVGGTLLGMCFGISDGFQLTDLFMGMAGSAIAGTAHEVMSNEDRQFLERCQALWLVGQHSPVELTQRIGPARSRILLYEAGWNSPVVCSHHHGFRGDILVPLGNAGDLAPGFVEGRSLEMMQRHFNPADLQTLQTQLYPHAHEAFPVEAVAVMSTAEAQDLDPHAHAFAKQSKPVRITANGQVAVGYQIPIPSHSDF